MRSSSRYAFALITLVACGSRTLNDAATSDASTDGGGDAFGDFSKCDASTQCILATPGCCATCGPTTLSSFVAIDASQASAFRSATCPAPQPCPNCASIPDPNFVAACRSGTCAALDLRTDPISACTVDADCRLRWGGDCCECTPAPYDLVSIASANEAELDAILCAPATRCARHCAAMPYPADKKPICDPTTHHCQVSP